MKNKVALVTGANSGTGKWTAINLARQGATVIMLCRNQERGMEAFNEVKNITHSDKIDIMFCDLASMASIRSFAKAFKKKYTRLDVLVNNAGVVLPGRRVTEDGFELQFGVNHLGHFLLTNLLLDLIIASAPARIVNVASGAHTIGDIHFNDIDLRKNYSIIKAYSRSKLANILFTYELAMRLNGTGVTVNALHPGAVASQMGINRDTGFGKLITKTLKPFFLTPEEGAQTAIYLASSKEVEGVNGRYFYKKQPISSSEKSYNKQIAKKLWYISSMMVKQK